MTTDLSKIVRWRLEVFQLMTPVQRIRITKAVDTIIKLEDEGYQFGSPFERDDIFRNTGFSSIASACYRTERANVPWRVAP